MSTPILQSENLTKIYRSADKELIVLDNVSFRVDQGNSLAIIGPSGSGKTTLVKMLVGLYTPDEGAIFYNEKNAKDIDLTELRQQLGFVTQDAQLFSGTIKDNLLFVKPNAV